MKEAFKKINNRLAEEQLQAEKDCGLADTFNDASRCGGRAEAYENAQKIVSEVEAESANDKNIGSKDWIFCSDRMPPVETEVYIVAQRTFKDGTCRYIRTTAMYEDGTVSENDSEWRWEDIEGEWDEENECYFIPEGWWENRHYNPDGCYNNEVDDKVIAWMPMPEFEPIG